MAALWLAPESPGRIRQFVFICVAVTAVMFNRREHSILPTGEYGVTRSCAQTGSQFRKRLYSTSYKVKDRPRSWQNNLLCGPLTHVDASFLEPVRASWIPFVPCSESNSKSLRVPRPRPFLLATFSRSSFKDAPLHALFGLTVRLAVAASRCAD
jgi:hypothetical protein